MKKLDERARRSLNYAAAMCGSTALLFAFKTMREAPFMVSLTLFAAGLAIYAVPMLAMPGQRRKGERFVWKSRHTLAAALFLLFCALVCLRLFGVV